MSLSTTAGQPTNTRFIMAGVLLALLLASLDQLVVATAMPKIIASLHGFSEYAWVTTSYMLTSTVTVPIYGKLSDIVGRKAIFLFGITLFLIGSALSGTAQTMTMLILFRGFQGFGAGAIMPIAIAIVGDLYPPKERGKIQGLTGAVSGISSILGPTLGGWITDGPGWRWVFYINIPLGILTLIVLALTMPALRPAGTRSKVDWPGAGLLVAWTVPLLLAFTWAGSTYPWGSPQIIGLLVLTVVMVAAFFTYERRVEQPILDPSLFHNLIFSDSVLISVLIGAGMFGAISYIPLFLQGVVGVSAANSGAVMTPLMLTAILGSILSGQLMSRWGRYRIIAVSGLLVMIGGMALLARLTVDSGQSEVVTGMIVLGFGLGFGLSLYTIVVQNAFPRERLGMVTSALTFFRSIGGTIGVAIMGSFLIGHFSGALRANLPAPVRAQIPEQVLSQFNNPQVLLSAQGQRILHTTFASLPHGAALQGSFLTALKEALTSSLHDVFLVGLVIAVLGTAAALFLKEIPLRGADAAAPVDSISEAGIDAGRTTHTGSLIGVLTVPGGERRA
ncbi:MAG TPA: MDR family MFS transporter [Chloroflexota bacterium]|nr:MDR family MFS transporter [Chloroflexota bacterium]